MKDLSDGCSYIENKCIEKRPKKKSEEDAAAVHQHIEEEYQVIDYRLVANHEMRNVNDLKPVGETE